MSDLRNAFDRWARQYKRTTLRNPDKSEARAFEEGWKAATALANRRQDQVPMFGGMPPAEPTPWRAPVADALTVDTLETSRAAAESMTRDGRKAEVARMLVLNAIRDRPGLTDRQLSDRLSIPENTVRPRRIELLDAGAIEPDGQGINPSGRKAVVWRVVPSAGGSDR